MNDGSKERGIDKIFDCVMWAVDQSIKHVNNVCPSREKWTWDRLVSSGSKNDNNNNNNNSNKTNNNNNYYNKNSNEKKQDIKKFNQKNIDDETIDLSVAANVNCCHIKIQDPCAACCCESNSHLPSTCPDGPRRLKKYPKCGCKSNNSSNIEACCEACKSHLHSV
ncbi:hypothetical protein HCN44_010137 [Aphidius gifuensis]|uniref:Uncharacterized protein n=1 Tax=Aphidius gifuensis TaxID=684658 RepID=A0A835CRQ1_APHGI|nr:E3 ubiquitin-protein ligase cblA-like [Aphidius gifuensis]KAF7993542.1 hypothetical protein HCN44_010137 [Aphidius gifuensis]